MCVRALEQHVGAGLHRVVEHRGPRRAAVEGGHVGARVDAVGGEAPRDLVRVRPRHVHPPDRAHHHLPGRLEQGHRRPEGARRLGAAVPQDRDAFAEGRRKGRRGQQQEAPALEQGGLAEDVPVGRGVFGLAADGDEVEDAPVLAHDLLAEAVELPPHGARAFRGLLPALDEGDPVRADLFGEARARLVAAPKLLVGELGHVPADGDPFARVDERGGLDEQPFDARAAGGGGPAREVEGGLGGSVFAERNQDGLHRLLHLGLSGAAGVYPASLSRHPGRRTARAGTAFTRAGAGPGGRLRDRSASDGVALRVEDAGRRRGRLERGRARGNDVDVDVPQVLPCPAREEVLDLDAAPGPHGLVGHLLDPLRHRPPPARIFDPQGNAI